MTEEPVSSSRNVSATRLSGALHGADRATSFVERPIRKFAGVKDLNPLPHAGTISVLLLGVVILSGLYITLFFSFGHAASYDAVAAMESHAIQRVVRALHRYSSAALVLTTLVHAWRVLSSQRFTARRRRWRWASGMASLGLVWLAGVTGYWLVWDRRAAAISEATAQLLVSLGVGNGFVVEHLLGLSPGSGSGMLLALWFVHLGLTAVIGWFMFRHLRRSRQAWFPPMHWTALMSVALLIVSLTVPLGMLGPARPDQLVVDMPLDPFVLFLLPPLLSELRWYAVIVATVVFLLVMALPWLLRRSDPAPIVIDEDACTGCELCVQDCPYEALSMTHVDTPGRLRERSVALLDPGQCVSCGICVGSCAFDAIELPGWTSPSPDVTGRKVQVICSRHEPERDPNISVATVAVSCAGMFTPNMVRGYLDRGATDVELIGCAPSDCRFGLGNQLAAERMAGSRAPHAPRRYRDRVTMAMTGVGDRHVSHFPGSEFDQGPPQRSSLAPPALLVLLSVVVVVAATRAPFRTDETRAAVRVVVDHAGGAEIVEIGQRSGAAAALEISVDGQERERLALTGDNGHVRAFGDWSIEPGLRQLEVVLVDDTNTKVALFDAAIEVEAQERFVVTATDVPPPPGADQGREVFTSRGAGCSVCHATERGRDGVGPSLYGIADDAGARVEGLTAEQYLRQSILLPDQFVVGGWPDGQMLPIYRERLTEEDLEALLVYLQTLNDEGSS